MIIFVVKVANMEHRALGAIQKSFLLVICSNTNMQYVTDFSCSTL
jgi:hypothetical protein